MKNDETTDNVCGACGLPAPIDSVACDRCLDTYRRVCHLVIAGEREKRRCHGGPDGTCTLEGVTKSGLCHIHNRERWLTLGRELASG